LCCLFLGIIMSANASAQRLKALENEYSRIYESSKNYAVTISVSAIPTARSTYYPLTGKENYEVAIGSGFIYDSIGHIITSSSVTEQGNLFRITFADGTSRFADLVGVDFENKVSVLKVPQPPFAPPRFADSDLLKPGHWIGLVGNSFGVFPSFAYGITAGKSENGDVLVTADLSPGCAGGLVVNSDGNVVGMIAYKLTEPVPVNSMRRNNTSKDEKKTPVLTDTELEMPVGGYSLVIPSNRIKEAADGVISGKIYHGAFLGVVPENLDVEWAKRVFNISYGVYITKVQENSPAFRAGIRDGDILLDFGWHKILSAAQLRKLILNSEPESKVQIKILRAGKTRTLTAELGYAYQAANSGNAPREEYVAPSQRREDSSGHKGSSGDTVR
jgi:serine protease Do